MTKPHNDPITQLENAHETLRRLFADWRSQAARKIPAAQTLRQSLAERICLEFTIHTRLEAELIYPLARQAIDEPGLLDRAAGEHLAGRTLMCQVLMSQANDPRYDERVNLLCEFMERHLRMEGQVLFPPLRRCGADLALLGRRLRERRRELEAVPEALREDAIVSSTA